MKTIIYSVTKVKRKYSHLITCRIYRLKNNKPEFLGECEIDTAMSRGEDSEVVIWCVDNKHLPKKSLGNDGYINYDERGESFQIHQV